MESFEATRIAPNAACVTNLTPDHLNRYRDMEDYADAKRAISRYQTPEDVTVLNADDPVVRGFSGDCRAQVQWFGTDPSLREGVRVTDEGLRLCGEESALLLPLGELPLRGAHNALNAAAAATLARANRVPIDQITEGLRTFAGLRDRMELVAEIGGVRYINDTASTVPASTVAALQSVEGRVILIAGGASKRVPFDDVADEICKRAARLILLEGSATEELQTEVNRRCSTLASSLHGSLKSAVEAAHAEARPGDTVLFSPACASFGMFDNEFQRGELFRQAVRGLGS